MELEQLKGVCRLCLEHSQHLEPLFDEYSVLVDKLHTLTQLQVAATEGWPAVVCPTCVDALNAADRFRSRCLESHRRLETFFSTPDSHSIVIKEERLDLSATGPDRVPDPLAIAEIKVEADSVCDPPLFVDVGPFEEEPDAHSLTLDSLDVCNVALETGQSSTSGEERFYCRISDPKFQEAIAGDVKRRRSSRKVKPRGRGNQLMVSDDDSSSDSDTWESKPVLPPTKQEIDSFLEDVWKACPDAAIFRVLPEYSERLAQRTRGDDDK